MRFLEAALNPFHDKHEEMLTWYGKPFDHDDIDERYRRARVALWHECKDVDLALWLDNLDSLNGLRRAKARALRTLWDEAAIGIASHRSTCSFSSPEPTATLDGCAI